MKYFISLIFLCSLSFATESRIKVAVIDTGIVSGELTSYLCKDGHKDLTGSSLEDKELHGTNMAGIISQYINRHKVCLLIIKYRDITWDGEIVDGAERVVKAINYAIQQNVTYINFSSSGEEPLDRERKAIEGALSQHIRVAVAAGNKGQDLSKHCNEFPACYPIKNYNFFVVGALDNIGRRLPLSNYNYPVTQYEDGLTVCVEELNINKKCTTGTSSATARFLGKLIQKETR